ncbi:MAG: hypothetical protein F6K26_46515 [Moorea sp. SIO2I5]|nr:hypothetical protein [Moorena sp. SIO2I5]
MPKKTITTPVKESKPYLGFLTPAEVGMGVSCRDNRTSSDPAMEVKELLDIDYPDDHIVRKP